MFFIVYGKRFFGRVDRVPGLFMVATQFFHIWFIPLIPTASFIILAGTEDGTSFRGIGIGLNAKSVLIAYVRAFLVIAGIVQIVRGILSVYNHYSRSYEPPPLWPGIYLISMGVIFWVTYVLSRKLVKASYRRALELAAQAGIDRSLIDMSFNQIASQVAAKR